VKRVEFHRLVVGHVVLGSGVPLSGANGETHGLRHLDTRTYDSGLVELRYAVGA
jgi:hypothetical protein